MGRLRALKGWVQRPINFGVVVLVLLLLLVANLYVAANADYLFFEFFRCLRGDGL